MKKIFCLVCFFLALFSLKSIADVPEGAIPFVFDGHLYLQSTLNDTIPVTLIYDTGADFLYLDEDYLKLNHLQNAFGRKGKATMGGAGNGEPERIDIFIDPITVHCGAREYQNEITPIIKLRDLLGRHTDGLLGNTHLLMNPLEINFSESYLRQLKGPLLAEQLDNYVKLDARFEDNRIDVKATLQIDDENSLEGWFRMDLGCGSTIILTQKQKSLLPSRLFHTQSLTNKISWQKFFSNLSSTLLTLISFHVTKIAVLSIFYNRRNRLKPQKTIPITRDKLP